MAKRQKVVTTVRQMRGADVVDKMGLVLRFVADDGNEHHVQFPTGEAHGLADMVSIAVSRLPKLGSRH